MKIDFETIHGGITAPAGYRAAAVRAGIKPSRKRDDLAILVSDRPAAAAGMFTTNKVKAAPVRLCQRHLEGGIARAIIVNAGNANACTGSQGMADAQNTAHLVAQQLGIPMEEVLVCSTGTIGIPLPMDCIESAIPGLVAARSANGGEAMAQAILTTDTVDKQIAIRFRAGGTTLTLAGIAKGSGMIEPNMATMLSFLTTDAAVAPAALRTCLKTAVERSFNRISVDGDQSTNDTVLLLANGGAGGAQLDESHPDWPVFCAAVELVTLDLAKKIVRDGEGATKFVTVTILGAVNEEDARKAARAVCNSLLVKTSWFGRDPNWGRLMDAIGYSGAQMQEELVDIRFNHLTAVRGGRVAEGVALPDLAAILGEHDFSITIDLHVGSGSWTMYTCDCSLDYVRINAEYMT